MPTSKRGFCTNPGAMSFSRQSWIKPTCPSTEVLHKPLYIFRMDWYSSQNVHTTDKAITRITPSSSVFRERCPP